MKIIKDNYTRIYQCTCGCCNSIYEFTRDEALKTAKKQISIKCPLCEYETFLASSKEEQFQNVVEIKEEKKVAKPKVKKVLLEEKVDSVKTAKKPAATAKSETPVVEEPKESTEVLSESQTA